MSKIVKTLLANQTIYSLKTAWSHLAQFMRYDKVMEDKMFVLTKNEILSELEKFGITTPDEITAFLRDYNNYFSIAYSHNSSC